jgi:hypothetical protein
VHGTTWIRLKVRFRDSSRRPVGGEGGEAGYACMKICTETDDTTVQCPNEKCRNDAAYWYQLQIRSADEPMTAFYKVSSTPIVSTRLSLTSGSARNVRRSGENDLSSPKYAFEELGSICLISIYPGLHLTNISSYISSAVDNGRPSVVHLVCV